MADIAKPSPPELKNLKPALPDVWDLAKLEASVNSTSQRAVTQWLAYLSLWAYLFFTTLSITDRALILLTPVKLPLIGVELGLQAFFWSAPPLFLVFHLYLVRKITVLARDVGFYRAAIHRFVPSEEAREPLYRRLDAFFLTRLLGHAEQGNLLRLFDGMIALATVAVMPLALMLAFQLRFLAFHDEYVTMWHRVCLVADVGLLVLLARWLKAVLGDRLRLLPEARGRWLRGGMEMARDMAGPVMTAYVAFSLLVATFPGEIHDGIVVFPDQDPDFLWRVLAPRDVDFVEDEKLDKVQWTIDLRNRDFRGAQMQGADLRKARMNGMDLRMANLREAKMQGADVSNSVMSYANISDSQLQGINFRESILINSEIVNSNLQGSDIRYAYLVGANLSLSQFQGADISESMLQGARIVDSHLQGVNFRRSNLGGADISKSRLQGADIRGVEFDDLNSITYFRPHNSKKNEIEIISFDLNDKTQLKGVNIDGINLWRVKFNKNTEFDYAVSTGSVVFSRGSETSEDAIQSWILAVPAGVNRDAMAQRLAVLREGWGGNDENDQSIRQYFSKEHKESINELTKYIDDLVCVKVGWAITGIMKIHGLNGTLDVYLHSTISDKITIINKFIRDTGHNNISIILRDFSSLEDVSVDHVALAKRFLDPTCMGEKHLTDRERARLRQIIRNSETTPAP